LALLGVTLISEGGLLIDLCLDIIVCDLISATLYMAVNEIRASAKESGMKFWEYGI
jgi:hypothetical protein